MSIREIARRTKLSRNTITKYLADGTVEPRYARRKIPKKTDAFATELTSWLESNVHQGRKRRRTVKQMYVALLLHGYSGSYGRNVA